MDFDVIVAMDSERGIGKDNALPWRLSSDMKYFKSITSTAPEGKMNAVIMGRKTWDSLPPKSRPLKGRLNIVISRSAQERQTAEKIAQGIAQLEKSEINSPCFVPSLDQALEFASHAHEINKCFVIGGAQIYAEALQHSGLRTVYLTQLDESFQCDVFFPQTRTLQLVQSSDTQTEGEIHFRYQVFRPLASSVETASV